MKLGVEVVVPAVDDPPATHRDAFAFVRGEGGFEVFVRLAVQGRCGRFGLFEWQQIPGLPFGGAPQLRQRVQQLPHLELHVEFVRAGTASRAQFPRERPVRFIE